MKKKLLKNAKIVDDKGIRKSDLIIEGEKIAGEEKRGFFAAKEDQAGLEVIDLAGKYLFPGLVDANTNCFFSSDSNSVKENFYQTSLEAAAGGITTIIDYIDFPENNNFREAVFKQKEKAKASIVDYSFHQILTDFNSNISESLVDLKDLGIASVKLFTTYQKEGYMLSQKQRKELFRSLNETKILAQVHAEDNDLIQDLKEIYSKRNLTELRFTTAIRPGISEALAIKKLGNEALEADIPLYIVHLSAAESLEAVRNLRAKKAQIYIETNPHYLMLDDSYLNSSQALLYLMIPPLKTRYNNQLLWQGVSQNEFQVLASNHFNFKAEKIADLGFNFENLIGIPGTETILALLYSSGVRNNRITIRELIEMLAVNPAKIFGLYPEKGSLEIGTDADLTVFDPNLEKRLKAANLYSTAKKSPYHDFTVKGCPIMTFRRGELIFEQKLKAAKGSGKFIFAHSSSLF